MSNMSYCRFENTSNSLEDCEEHLLDELSDSEKRARKRLVYFCQKIVDNYEELDDDE